MKIGISITTTSNRAEHLKLCVKQIEKHTKDYTLHIAKDVPTIAKAKNECLHALKDCDHIFLYDDDTFPIKDGWVDFFINSGQEHLLYLTQRHKVMDYSGFPMQEKQYPAYPLVKIYGECGGCFMYIRKDAFERVGYFNTEYKKYGFEHCGFSNRIKKGSYLSLDKTSDYLYSLDYQGEGNWGVRHKPSITDFKAMGESIEYNRQVFQKEITSDKIYYEYKP